MKGQIIRGDNNPNYDPDGYPDTSDGFVEGFAEFMPAVMLNQPEYHRENLEGFGGHAGNRLNQEYAIAAILFDIYDNAATCGNAADDNTISLNIQQIWAILLTDNEDPWDRNGNGIVAESNGYLDIHTVSDLYNAFHDSALCDPNGDGVFTELNAIFTAHGYDPLDLIMMISIGHNERIINI